jgi:hypothetical protein
MPARKPRPRERKLRVELHCLFIKTDRFRLQILRVGVARFKSQAAQIRIVSLRIVCRFGGDDLLFLAGQLRSQLVGDGFGNLTLNLKDFGQFAIIGITPKMRVIGCFD